MIIFRTNAGQEGLGHLSRVFSLYKQLNERIKQPEFLFIVNEEAKPYLLNKDIEEDRIKISKHYDMKDLVFICEKNPKLLVIDTYKADSQYIKKLRQNDIKIALFIDTMEYEDIKVDYLINGNIYADSTAYKTLLKERKIKYSRGLLGIEYIILNPSIKKEKDSSKRKKTITITTGGADPKDLMPVLIQKINIKSCKRNIIVGPFFTEKQKKKIELLKRERDTLFYAPKTLNKIITTSDIVISSAGSTVYEILFHKKTFALFQMGEDQRMIVDYFKEQGIIILTPEFDDKKKDINLDKLLQETYQNNCRLYGSKVNGKGSKKIAEILIKEI